VLGGLRGLFTQMSADKVGPNLKTLNEMAQIIHPTDVSVIFVASHYKFYLSPNVHLSDLMVLVNFIGFDFIAEKLQDQTEHRLLQLDYQTMPLEGLWCPSTIRYANSTRV
jgi:hypothetical protein